MSLVNTDHLETLGESATNNIKRYSYDKPAPEVLETFPNPITYENVIDISIPEWTALCPKTGQPDFATIAIRYTPNKRCVESKSLKLYMMSYRNHGEFHESVVQRICDDLVNLLHPKFLSVKGEFAPRGGISIVPTAEYFE